MNVARVSPLLAVGLVLLSGSPSRAGGLALFRLDPLGVEPAIVSRLEGLLRIELGRLADAAMPTPRRIREVVRQDPSLQDCTGDPRCLTTVGQLLGVGRVISGNVGGLAGNYVINLKIVDVTEGKELRRIQEPISGEPDELIEAVRVAAYGLVAPERLRGALAVLADQPKASVYLDGTLAGYTPLPTMHGLTVGEHVLRVSKEGYSDVVRPVRVRFQKTAQVVVKLQLPKVIAGKGPQPTRRNVNRPYPWYTRWWFWTVVGVAAAGIGAGLGYAVAGETSGINCREEPRRCGL